MKVDKVIERIMSGVENDIVTDTVLMSMRDIGHAAAGRRFDQLAELRSRLAAIRHDLANSGRLGPRLDGVIAGMLQLMSAYTAGMDQVLKREATIEIARDRGWVFTLTAIKDRAVVPKDGRVKRELLLEMHQYNLIEWWGADRAVSLTPLGQDVLAELRKWPLPPQPAP